MNLPTAYWHAWTADLDATGGQVPDDIRLVVVGGEKALGPALRTWLRVSGGRSRWVNAYGPTETTCMSTFWEASGPARGPRPADRTAACRVDDRGRRRRRGAADRWPRAGPGLPATHPLGRRSASSSGRRPAHVPHRRPRPGGRRRRAGVRRPGRRPGEDPGLPGRAAARSRPRWPATRTSPRPWSWPATTTPASGASWPTRWEPAGPTDLRRFLADRLPPTWCRRPS